MKLSIQRLSLIVLFAAVAAFLVVTLSVSVEAAKKKGKGNEASRYTDCESCVEAGFGWSWEDDLCGTYANTDCSLSQNEGSSQASSRDDAANEYDDDDDVIEDESSTSPKTFSWQDSEATTHIWHLIHSGNYDALAQLLDQDSDLVKYRSADGRGALWWAYEYGKSDMVSLLIAAGADESATDKGGDRPADMMQYKAEL